MVVAEHRPRLRRLERLSRVKAVAAPERVARMPAFSGSRPDVDPDRVLGRLQVILAGAGSVGGPCILSVARQDPRAIIIADPKPYKPESLLTNSVIFPRDLRRWKADHVAKCCVEVSRSTRVDAFVGGFEDLPLTRVAGVDFIFCCTDRMAAELHVARAAMHLGIPVIYCNVEGSSGLYQIRYFANSDPQDACPACNMTPAELRMAADDGPGFSCEMVGERDQAGREEPVTRSIPALCALAGHMGALLMNKVTLRLGQPLPNSCLVEGTFIRPGYAAVIPLGRNQDCVEDHSRWRCRPLAKPLRGHAIRELLEVSGMSSDGGDAVLGLGDDFRYVVRAECPRCGPRSIGRFWSKRRNRRCRCGAELRTNSFHTFDAVPLSVLRPQLDQRVATLGATSASWALIRHHGAGTWLSWKDAEGVGES